MTAIRDLQSADQAQWRALWDGYNAFYGREGATALAPEVVASTWARLLDPSEPVHGIVFEDGGRLQGLAHYLFHRSTISIANTCYLQDLFTLPGERGRGIARALIEAVYERARCASAARVYWQTHESNAVARRLYDRIGEHSGFIVYRRVFPGTAP